ncbi:MAG: DUF4190 domain-containing protein [Planctomycetota bacterium]
MPVFSCNVCGAQLSAEDRYAGRKVKCPTCQSIQTVPGAEDLAPVSAKPTQETFDTSLGTDAPPVPSNRPDPRAAPTPPKPAASQRLSADTVRAHKGTGRRYGFNCQYCSSRLEANEGMAGSEGHCPTCGNTIIIPILDRYGRLIDPMTGKVVKPPPHPVHAYAAAGERAPKILRQGDGSQVIKCPRCGANNSIQMNNCKSCGMPFTMEGTTLEAAGANNGFCVASLVLGIIGIPAGCTIIVPLLAIVFGIVGIAQSGEGGGKGMAIAGIICGGIGCLIAMSLYLT